MITRIALALIAAVSSSSTLASQAQFVETFDDVGGVAAGSAGPASLEADGWVFRNQSEPIGSMGWFDGWLFSSFEGSGHMEASGSSVDFFGGDLSLWAILPAVAGQAAGDDVTLHVERSFSHNDERLQILYSPSGDTSTGTSAHDLGDFSTVLADVALTSTGWQTVTAVAPGDGRLAIRFAVENACNFGCASAHIGLDLVSVGPAPGPGCNLPPLPEPGETVHWTSAGSPWEICADVSIPEGATVIVDAGARVEIEAAKVLTVSGRLDALGTPGAPVVFEGGGSFFGPAVSIRGEALFEHTHATAYVKAAHGGTLTALDSTFTTAGLGSDDLVGGQDHGTYVHVERCQFTAGAAIMATDATLVVIDTDLTGDGGVSLLRGYFYGRNISVNGSGVSITRERYTQPTLLTDLTITNSPVGGLVLQGWDFLVGPDVTLVDNAYPVQLTGGLLPGSHVPATGNVSNYVDAGNGGIVGSSTWGALDVPYVVNASGGTVGGSSLAIEAGATVEFKPNASLIYYAGAGIQARGTPEAPITLRAHQPGTTWNRLKFQSNSGRTHFQHTDFQDAEVALQSDNAFLFVDSSTFRDNETGTWTNTGGLLEIRGSRYIGNDVGAHEESGNMDLEGTTNPNTFVGNGLAVEGGNGNATNNWWGDASGPSHPSNPGGAGDAATAGVQVVPFLTSPPNTDDTPPQVRILSHGGLTDTGSKVFVRWEVEDDSLITGQRILYSPHGNFQYTTLVGGLDGQQRTFEWDVPLAELSSILDPAYLRVVAVDDAGQEGWDEVAYTIPYVEDLPPVTFEWLTDLSSGYTFGDEIDVCWQQTGMSATFSMSLWSDSDGGAVPFGGAGTQLDCWTVRMPYVSTDRARIAIRFNIGAAGRSRTFFTEPFTLRPDAQLPDAPPTIALTSPGEGSVFSGGDVVSLGWTASDDEALREIRLFVSTNAGRTWQGITTLPGDATAFAWKLPASSGIDDVIVRAVAVDARSQHSSTEVTIDVAPGGDALCQTNLGFNGPGQLVLSLCGEPLATGSTAELRLSGAQAQSPVWLFVSNDATPTPFAGGTLVTVPIVSTFVLATDASGGFGIDVPGGLGPAAFTVQAASLAVDASTSLSNALAVELLP